MGKHSSTKNIQKKREYSGEHYSRNIQKKRIPLGKHPSKKDIQKKSEYFGEHRRRNVWKKRIYIYIQENTLVVEISKRKENMFGRRP